ncbi:type I restriction-modification system subunit M/S [Streptomyces violascens]|uniref:type I restriction-modification system subunit M/S n=1 Tax=Streptomyces violascens TaxID=67381 RepID=UPI0036BBD4E4
MAGVRRSAITNWERRHATFPAALRSGDVEYFRLADVIQWLDFRHVPSKNRHETEPEGVTYGDRLRVWLDRRTGPDPSNGDSPSLLSVTDDEDVPKPSDEAMAELLRQPMMRRWGARTHTEYLPLLACLILLRWAAPQRWEALGSGTPMTSRDLLRRVGSDADKLLRDRGLVPAMQSALQGLMPERDADPLRLLSLIDRLDRGAFRELLDMHGEEAALDSREAFTPKGVAELLGWLSVADGPVRRVSDPYARGGELLAAVIAAGGEGPLPEVHAVGSRSGLLRLAAMNLMVHGVVPEMDAEAGAPWLTTKTGRRPGADRVLANPPFNASSGETRQVNWRYGAPPPSNDNLAWPQYVLSTLEPGGRACMVMADNAAVSDHPRERAIRQAMIDDGVVECVVALPSNLFTATSVSACIWVLTTPSKRTTVHFINARSAGKMVSRTRRELERDDVRLLGEVHRALLKGSPLPADVRALGRSVSVQEIKAGDCSLSPVDYVTAGSDKVATTADVAESCTELLTARDTALSADAAALSLLSWPDAAESGAALVRSSHGWERKRLGDLCTIQAGPSPSLLSAAMQSPEGVVPVVHPKHLRDRRISCIEENLVSEHDAHGLRRFLLRDGDIVCTRTGTVGPSALVGASEANCLYNNNLLRLYEFAPDVDSRFVLAFLSHPEALAWIKDRASMTTVASIKTRTLLQLPVPLPPLEEQRRIGDLLQALDSQIVAHRRVAASAERVRGDLTALLMSGALPTSHREGDHR